MDFPTYKVTERTYRYGVRIPDSNFFDYLVSTYDLVVDKDGKISPYDTLRITKIDCSHRGIESFAGIESFPNLTYLNCGWNPVKKLELRNHYKLNYLFCHGCELSHLDVMLCHFLTVLNCRFNRLRTLNLDYCYSLRLLSCCNNLLKTLDVTPCSDSIRVNRNDNPGLFEIIHRVQQRSI